jgi:hypothetical protein
MTVFTDNTKRDCNIYLQYYYIKIIIFVQLIAKFVTDSK